ncbi:hypothetical protein HF521_021329 [Silurus meridionalis]|uniref:Uncharacterized protein n=1 Tax=Silurus meridionalis TaxID=175797 RepID=A0A8T0BEH7_SILME|nr:hypothetical protein HF521_021329 [Silurus meridionalis]
MHCALLPINITGLLLRPLIWIIIHHYLNSQNSEPLKQRGQVPGSSSICAAEKNDRACSHSTKSLICNAVKVLEYRE